ncbi:hypothetical protein JOC95_001882 [Bacillus tianshenii]|uniref:Uncharacterized protein n=1 Tax=Sutcliffiella tianshenii TaxID=1463404 RepID=A0ABS2P0R6_9BACI|nr:hypothetical protein [Bacillus tianshenii]MBM7620030.1 hypothetical protein [Bacillus tianshenii]
MATFTCQVLVGQKNSYDGGIINVSHTLFLSENSIPAWTLKTTGLYGDSGESPSKVTWIPTLEHMLEDALVMIGLFVLKDEGLLKLANKFFLKPEQNYAEFYSDLTTEQRQELYQHTRKIESSHKIILTVFEGSSISKHLPALETYQNDIEVCTSVYRKEFSLWTKSFEERGAL